MAVLRERKVWRKPKAPKSLRAVELDAVQCDNVLAALFTVRERFRGWSTLARALGMPPLALYRVIRGEAAPEAGLGVGIARIADVSPGEVISGEFAKPRRCPLCGTATPSAPCRQRFLALESFKCHKFGAHDGACTRKTRPGSADLESAASASSATCAIRPAPTGKRGVSLSKPRAPESPTNSARRLGGGSRPTTLSFPSWLVCLQNFPWVVVVLPGNCACFDDLATVQVKLR
jgi:hypothetical protein